MIAVLIIVKILKFDSSYIVVKGEAVVLWFKVVDLVLNLVVTYNCHWKYQKGHLAKIAQMHEKSVVTLWTPSL